MRSISVMVPAAAVTLTLMVAAGSASSPSPAGAQGNSAEELYVANCAGCHQPDGAGLPGTFPPLAGNPAAADTEYVTVVITDGKSGPIDVLGESYDAVMPPISALSGDEAAAVADYVAELSTGTGEPSEPTDPSEPTEPTEPAEPAEPVDPPTEGDVDRGKDLFVGSDRFAEGGGACASCHTAGEVGNLGGSSLGPDLTDVYQTLGGAAGLSAWLANPPAPTMTPIFGDKPLTEDEIAHLTAFLADAPDQDRNDPPVDWLVVGGLVGLVVLIGGMAIAWRGPRKTYVETLRSKR